MPPFSVTELTPSVGITPAFIPDVAWDCIVKVAVSDDMGTGEFPVIQPEVALEGRLGASWPRALGKLRAGGRKFPEELTAKPDSEYP